MKKYTKAPELTKVYIKKVWEKLPSFVKQTTIISNPLLSKTLGYNVTVASETFQYTGSFKFRAAYNLLSNISQHEVITASSGNFGQAIAYTSKLLNKKSTIVMPTTAAKVKIDAVKEYGGEVDIIDVNQISRNKRVEQLLSLNPNAFWAKPYDDYMVVAGNSTLGKEILELFKYDSIMVPIGGGGLASGIVLARDLLNAKTKIIGIEPALANDASRSLKRKTLIANEYESKTIADGVRTLSLGQLNWEILKDGLDEVIEVSEEAIKEALSVYFLKVNLKVEPTGALALSALINNSNNSYGKNICCIASGGNADPTVYADILLGK